MGSEFSQAAHIDTFLDLLDKDETVIVNAYGKHISKAISVVELVKRECKFEIQQNTDIYERDSEPYICLKIWKMK